MEKYNLCYPAYLTQRKIIANWNFEHKLFSEHLSIGATEIGCLSHPEISEYSFKCYKRMIFTHIEGWQSEEIDFHLINPNCQPFWMSLAVNLVIKSTIDMSKNNELTNFVNLIPSI